MDTVIIPANGACVRWIEKAGYPKQLADVFGESVISRIIRMASQRGGKNITVLTRDEMVRSHVRLAAEIVSAFPTDSVAETILCSAPLWSGKVAILLSDVIFSDAVMNGIFGVQTDLLRVWGRTDRCRDVFGMTFGEVDYPRVHKSLTQSVELCKTRPFSGCSLFTAYRYYCLGDPLDLDWFEHNGVFNWVTDETMDIDELHIYEEFMREKNFRRKEV